MALLQPAPEVYELFDDILLMAEGHVIFHGPKEDVLPFFEGLGFKLPARKGIGDFLQEVTTLLIISPGGIVSIQWASSTGLGFSLSGYTHIARSPVTGAPGAYDPLNTCRAPFRVWDSSSP